MHMHGLLMNVETKILWMTSWWGIYNKKKKFEIKKVVIDESATLEAFGFRAFTRRKKREDKGK